MIINEAIILAGGFGTRLQSVLPELPKPMAPIGDRPFLSYLIQMLKKNGIEKVILSLGYKYEVIQNYFRNFHNGVYIEYYIENEPLGTGGAIYKALQLVYNKNCFIINGDTYFATDLSKLAAYHLEKESKLTLALKPMENADRYGNVLLDDTGKISGFQEKEYREHATINAGVYVIDKFFIAKLALPQKFSFEEQVLQKKFAENNFYGLVSDDYFIDIGVPEDYEKAQTELPAIHSLIAK